MWHPGETIAAEVSLSDSARTLHTDSRIESLLALARDQLGLPVAFLGRFDGDDRELRAVSSSVPLPVSPGFCEPRENTHCQRIVDGRMPYVVPDVASTPSAYVGVPAVEAFHIGAFAGVPVHLPSGELYGTLCCIGFAVNDELTPRDAGVLRVLASALGTLIDEEEQARARSTRSVERLQQVLESGGPDLVYQPIVALASLSLVGMEALSRFPAGLDTSVEQWFDEAVEVGLGVDLDLAVVDRAVRDLPQLPGDYVSVNLTPQTAASAEFFALATGLPLTRMVIEITEHQEVADYHVLAAALAPLREAGLRVAVDDVGAGYASMRHILALVPDIIKIDRSLVAGLDHDPGRDALIAGLTAFARATGASVVAEGIENAGELEALRTLGVSHGQGYHLGRPMPLHAPAGALAGSAAQT